jgi:hypothetical protein
MNPGGNRNNTHKKELDSSVNVHSQQRLQRNIPFGVPAVQNVQQSASYLPVTGRAVKQVGRVMCGRSFSDLWRERERETAGYCRLGRPGNCVRYKRTGGV